MKSVLILFAMISCCFSQDYFTQSIKPWEKLGITSKEYAIAQKNGMPEDSIRLLIGNGIGITEYYSCPWDSIGISRERWFKYRHAGYTDKMIIADLDNTGMRRTTNIPSEFKQQKKSAFGLIPGYCQIKSGRKRLGIVQIAIGGIGVAGMVSCAIIKREAMPIPFLLCILPVIPWSFATQ